MAVATKETTTTKAAKDAGKIVQIIGPVLDVQFEEGHLPQIYDALSVKRDGGGEVIAEVQQHLGNNWVRAVSMAATDGLRRGMEAISIGGPITVPVGEETLGRLFNVVGEPIDGKGPEGRAARPHPPRSASVHGTGDPSRDLRDGDEGHRPH